MSEDTSPPPSASCPIILGITGHRFLPEDDTPLRESLTNIYAAFSSHDIRSPNSEKIAKLREDLGFPEKNLTTGIPTGTPIWILSPLADGADTLAAEIARDFYAAESSRRSVRFIAPLPIPWEFRNLDRAPLQLPKDDPLFTFVEFGLPLGGRKILRKETTFPRKLPPGANIPDTHYLDWADPEKFDPAILEQTSLKPCGAPGAKFDDEQYLAGALYVALYSHVVIALWDGVLREKLPRHRRRRQSQNPRPRRRRYKPPAHLQLGR